MRVLGISPREFRRLSYELDDFQAIAILKSQKYYGAPEIAPYFSKFGIDSDAIHYLNSTNADKEEYSAWGDLDSRIPEKKRMFFYWIPIDIVDEGDDPVLQETVMAIDQDDEGNAKRYKKIDPLVWKGIRSFITVGEVLEAMDNVFPGQENAILNFGPEGKIYGQINSIFEDKQRDGEYCIMTLAPYKNGRRSMDLSVNGVVNPPLKFDEIRNILRNMDPEEIIRIRYRDPFALGPNAGRVLEQTVDHIIIDKIYGVFMRPKTDIKPHIVTTPASDSIQMVNERLFKMMAPSEIKQLADIARKNVRDSKSTMLMVFTSNRYGDIKPRLSQKDYIEAKSTWGNDGYNWWIVTGISVYDSVVTMTIEGIDSNTIWRSPENYCCTLQDLLVACQKDGVKTIWDIDQIVFEKKKNGLSDSKVRFTLSKYNGLVNFYRKGNVINGVSGSMQPKFACPRDVLMFGFKGDDRQVSDQNASYSFLGR